MSNWDLLMQEVLVLAARGGIRVAPNPLVGALVYQDGQVIGKGFHQEYGQEHAEVLAIRDALSQGFKVKGATVVVNLEPCAHVGQQPACADFLIAQGVKRVVIGQLDPNPLVNGQGVQKLTLAGVEVITGVLSKECEDLNEVFNYYIKNKLPWVTMKAACSLDGKIGYRGEETKITGLAAQKFTHLLRSKHQAILIGAKTALVDNPALTVRFGKPQRQPLRVVLDSSGATLNQDLKIFQDQQYLIFTSKLKVSESSRVIGVDATSGGLDLRQVLQNLALRKISSVLVEGGGKIFTSFLSQQLVNKVYFFVAYKLLAKNSALTLFSEDLDLNLRLKKVKNLSLAEDLMIEGYL